MESAGSARHTVQFTATGTGYFGIWIVNLVLTIITLGIYSPWAKVRRLRYFYGNTLVDGSPFEFHGSPVAMLKGRIVAAALLVAYSQSSKVSFTLWIVVVAAIAAALPWLLWKSLRFRLANSSYRGIRFGFNGTLRGAYRTFVLPILLFVAPAAFGIVARTQIVPGRGPRPWLLGLAGGVSLLAVAIAPWLYRRIKRYQHGHAQLGAARFSFSGTTGDAYVLAFKALAFGMLGLIAGVVVGGLAGGAIGLVVHGAAAAPLAPMAAAASRGPGVNWMTAMVTGVIAGYLAVLSILPVITALTQNFVWGRTALDGRAFDSACRGFALWRIDIGNFVLMLLTLGLYWPFAVVRHLRYRLSTVSWTGDPAALLAGAADGAVSATGEEAADLLGFDLGL